ncbi:MAG: response regulator [Ktedonobacterales bacterium]|jgi:DNA-binding response OmpR family regulator
MGDDEPYAPPLAPRRVVLIVDDEQPIAEALGMIVADAGCVALLASNGRQGLALARERLPVLVITDLMMPQMDGAELIATLRRDAAAAGRNPPVTVLTTAAPLARAGHILADAYLRKPFDITEVEALLHRFLDPPGHTLSSPDHTPQTHTPER